MPREVIVDPDDPVSLVSSAQLWVDTDEVVVAAASQESFDALVARVEALEARLAERDA